MATWACVLHSNSARFVCPQSQAQTRAQPAQPRSKLTSSNKGHAQPYKAYVLHSNSALRLPTLTRASKSIGCITRMHVDQLLNRACTTTRGLQSLPTLRTGRVQQTAHTSSTICWETWPQARVQCGFRCAFNAGGAGRHQAANKCTQVCCRAF